MKLVIISDIHDNRLYLEKCRAYCLAHAIEAILCTGDICDEETLERLDDFNIPVYVIRGNGDFFEDSACDSLKHVTCLGRTGEVTLENKKIFVMNLTILKKYCRIITIYYFLGIRINHGLKLAVQRSSLIPAAYPAIRRLRLLPSGIHLSQNRNYY